MRLLLTTAVLTLSLAGAAQAQTPPPAPAPGGRVSARLPIVAQPTPDQRLERLDAALTDIDSQLRGLKAQSESLTGLTPDQLDRLQEALERLSRTEAALSGALKDGAAPAGR